MACIHGKEPRIAKESRAPTAKGACKSDRRVLSLVRVDALLLSVVDTEVGLVDLVAAVEAEEVSLFSQLLL